MGAARPARSQSPDCPDSVHLLASLFDVSRSQPLPLIAAATGIRPITWHRLDRAHMEVPAETYAVGMIGGGTTTAGADVLFVYVVDIFERQRAVIIRSGHIIDTAEPTGDLVNDCRAALGLPRAA